MGIAQANEEVKKILDEFSSDSDSSDEEGDHGGSEVVFVEEPASIEVFREKTIEDIIEEQRAKLAAEGKAGTPVTEETFAAWRTARLARRQAEAEARMKLEQTKRKGGKGLCKYHVMSYHRLSSVLLTVCLVVMRFVLINFFFLS